jgi:hypothetical protein
VKYDVWQCWTNARTSWRATEHRKDDSLKPPGSHHVDTVEAVSKRQAVCDVVERYRKG